MSQEIKQFAARGLLVVAFEAWRLVGDLLSATVMELGGEPLDLTMPCRHVSNLVRLKRYSQREFFKSVDGIDLDQEERKWKEERASREAAKKAAHSPN
jgi:hypothetical protein